MRLDNSSLSLYVVRPLRAVTRLPARPPARPPNQKPMKSVTGARARAVMRLRCDATCDAPGGGRLPPNFSLALHAGCCLRAQRQKRSNNLSWCSNFKSEVTRIYKFWVPKKFRVGRARAGAATPSPLLRVRKSSQVRGAASLSQTPACLLCNRLYPCSP